MYRISRLIPVFIVASAFASLSMSPRAQAVVPKPDGGYGLPLYGAGNTAEGDDALFKLAAGAYNTGLGWVALYSNIFGNFNTAVGSGALLANTANENTATGAGALLFNTTGSQNTANGTFALIDNTTGHANTAVGDAALEANTTGISNTAVGAFALQASNSTFNTAVGVGALLANQFSENTAVGHLALAANTSGGSNTAVGFQALLAETDGLGNSAFGDDAMSDFISGDKNTAVGLGAGSGITTGSGNVYVGADVAAVDGETDHTYIRNINSTSVSGTGTDAVTINLSTGLLGHLSSSRRHKEDIHPMRDASETLYQLKPVTYRYKKEIDVTQGLDYGLVAEEVAAVDPNLVACNREGQVETVRYTAVNAMLLNEFLKEHNAFINEQHKVSGLQATVAEQQQQIEALTAGLQKVSAQLEVSKGSPRTVLNSQ